MGWPANYGTNNVVRTSNWDASLAMSKQSGVPLDNFQMNQWSIWAQDSWKANRRLTLNLVCVPIMRASGTTEPAGNQVWVQSSYVDSRNGTAIPGLAMECDRQERSTLRIRITAVFYDPRVGLIYDIRGTGKNAVACRLRSVSLSDFRQRSDQQHTSVTGP